MERVKVLGKRMGEGLDCRNAMISKPFKYSTM